MLLVGLRNFETAWLGFTGKLDKYSNSTTISCSIRLYGCESNILSLTFIQFTTIRRNLEPGSATVSNNLRIVDGYKSSDY